MFSCLNPSPAPIPPDPVHPVQKLGRLHVTHVLHVLLSQSVPASIALNPVSPVQKLGRLHFLHVLLSKIRPCLNPLILFIRPKFVGFMWLMSFMSSCQKSAGLPALNIASGFAVPTKRPPRGEASSPTRGCLASNVSGPAVNCASGSRRQDALPRYPAPRAAAKAAAPASRPRPAAAAPRSHPPRPGPPGVSGVNRTATASDSSVRSSTAFAPKARGCRLHRETQPSRRPCDRSFTHGVRAPGHLEIVGQLRRQRGGAGSIVPVSIVTSRFAAVIASDRAPSARNVTAPATAPLRRQRQVRHLRDRHRRERQPHPVRRRSAPAAHPPHRKAKRPAHPAGYG